MNHIAAAAKIQQQNQCVAEIIRQNQNRKKRELQRDRATIQAKARILDSTQSSAADKAKATAVINRTVLKGTGFSASDVGGPQRLARVTADLLKDPTVIELGVKGILALKYSAEDAPSIPKEVLQRLNKLV
jgi:hypothetical protein